MKKQPSSAGRFLASHFPLFFLPVWLLALPVHAAPPEAKLTVVRPVIAGQAVNARMLATDVDGDALTFELVGPPQQGTVVLDNPRTGDFTYTANPNATQARDSFTFQVRDASGVSGVQTVHLTLHRVRRSVTATGRNTAGQTNVSGWRDIAALAAGLAHTVALKADGAVVAVGSNEDDQLNVGSWSNIVAVAAGERHTVGVKDDGSVVATGWNNEGQTDVGGWSDIVAVAAGENFTVGLKADGTAVLAGNDHYGQLNVSAWRDIVAVAAGTYHVVGLKADGTAVAVGNGSGPGVSGWDNLVAVAAGRSYTLGVKSDGTVARAATQDAWHSAIDGWRNVVGVAAGSVHIVGVTQDGTVMSAGPKGQYYDQGQFDVDDWQQVVAVAAGYEHTVALTANLIPIAADYTLYVEPGHPTITANLLSLASDPEGDSLSIKAVTDGSHGTVLDNRDGTLTYTPQGGFTGSDSFTYTLDDGHGGIVTTSVPVIVTTDWDGDGLPNLWEQANGLDPVDAASDQGADGDPDGDRYSNLEEYQHGTDPQGAVSHPDLAPLARLTLVRPVMAGGTMSAQLHANDRNGDVTYEVVVQPKQGSVIVNAKLGSFTYTTAPNADGRDRFSFRVRNAQGVSATQTVQLAIQRAGRRLLTSGSNGSGQSDLGHWRNIAAVAAGEGHTVGLVTDGTVVAAGYNGQGQVDVSGWADIVAVAAYGSHTVGLKNDGTVLAVGDNTYGQLNVVGWTDIVAVAAGYGHTVGLKSDGTVMVAGANYGQLDVNGWRDIVAVAAGVSHTVGLKADGSVLAVGSSSYGATDVGSWRDVVALSAGVRTVALKSDGTVLSTGTNDISSWRDMVAVSEGLEHTVGLKADGTVLAVGRDYGQLDVGGWRDIAAVAAGWFHTVGLERNHAPVARDITLRTAPGVASTTPDLLALASDADDDTLSISAFSQGAHGTVRANGDGTLTYTPGAGFTGLDRFTYMVSDDYGAKTSATVTVLATATDGAVRGGGGGVGLPFLGALGILAAFAGWRRRLGA